MPGLVLEGGTFRPIFSSGVMDALLDAGIMFPYCIGVSAGIADGISYVSRQKGRNLEVGKKYRHDKRYVGVSNLKTQKSVFGLDFVFGEIPNHLIPFDWDTFRAYQGKFMVGVTNALTGKAEYLDGAEMDGDFTMLRASCAIPVCFPAIDVNGTPYFDGAIADPIPIKKSRKDGNRKNLIVLTRPKGYVKKPSHKNKAAAQYLKKKYPDMERALLRRHILYNKVTAYCEKLENSGQAVIIRPEYPIKSFEGDLQTLETSYWHGYGLAMRKMEEIKALF